MKKHILIIVLFLGGTLSCSNKFDIESVDFKVTLLDDVSPVKVRCSIEGNWKYVRWDADGGLNVDYEGNTFEGNTFEHLFISPGTHTIEVSTWKGDTKYIGEKEITIPARATKLKIEGFQLHDIDINPLSLAQGTYVLEIDYYNGEIYDYHSRTVVISHTSSGVILLNDLITLNITDYNSNYYLIVRLKRIEPDAVDIFKRSNWSLEGANIDSPEILRTKNIDNKKYLSLVVDWMP